MSSDWLQNEISCILNLVKFSACRSQSRGHLLLKRGCQGHQLKIFIRAITQAFVRNLEVILNDHIAINHVLVNTVMVFKKNAAAAERYSGQHTLQGHSIYLCLHTTGNQIRYRLGLFAQLLTASRAISVESQKFRKIVGKLVT